MIHNNEVLGKTIDVISKFTDLYIDAMFYIVQNVYGKIIVYVDSKEEDIVINLKKHLVDAIDVWLRTCERYEDNYFARIEIEEWKKENTPIKNRIWVFEKYITNVYWDAKRKRKKKCPLHSKLVSFYTFKGGVGRTTTMMKIGRAHV